MLAEGLAFFGGQGAHFADIRSGHKGLLSAAGDDQRTDLAVSVDDVHQFAQIGENVAVERVERLGTVDGGNRDVALFL